MLAAQPADRLINVLARQMNGEPFQPHEIPLGFLLFSFLAALVTSKGKILSVRHDGPSMNRLFTVFT